MRVGFFSSFILTFLLYSFAFSISAMPAEKADSKAAAAKPQPTEERLFFAVSEGASSSIDPIEAVNKYVPLANVLGKAAGLRVVVSLVRNFEALELGMKNDEFELVMARPSNYMARGVRDYGYSLVATSKPDGQCFFVVNKESTLKKLEEIKGKQIMFPEKAAFMTKFCGAELRDHGIDINREPQVRYAKEQGAIGWAVEKKLVDVGIVASFSPVAKNWEKNGGIVLHKTAPQPYFPLVVTKRVSADKLAKMQKALAELNATEEGKKVLSSLGIQGFNIESKDRLMNLLKWLDKE
jgi:phosphonate transport system substrate-binding protein